MFPEAFQFFLWCLGGFAVVAVALFIYGLGKAAARPMPQPQPRITITIGERAIEESEWIDFCDNHEDGVA